MNYQKILDDLCELYFNYASVYRHSIQPIKAAIANDKQISYDYRDTLVRETLIEHVGHLPITATFLYPFVQDEQVDLGDVLVYLAIHDIGELELGDVPVFLKNDDIRSKERENALKKLPTMLHESFEEMESLQNPSAKFAKSVDKMVADILEFYVLNDISFQRYESMGISREEIVAKKREKKMPYMEWNVFLTEFYDYLLGQLEMRINSI